LPELSLTLAVFLWPELGFLGLVMPTFKHTPFMAGRRSALSTGETAWRAFLAFRPFDFVRSWFRVMESVGVEVKVRLEVHGRKVAARKGFGAGEMVRRPRARMTCKADEDGMGGIVNGFGDNPFGVPGDLAMRR
jgi:hypothetical protein